MEINNLEFIEITIGAFFAVVLSMALGIFAGIIGSYLGLFLTTGIITYYFISDVRKGTVYGVLVGIAAGIISTILMLTFEFILGGKMDLSFMTFGFGGIIIGIMVNGIISMVGGAVGSILNH